jgi:hypothetical protein
MTTSAAAFTTSVVRDGGYCELPRSPGLGISLVDDYELVAPVVDQPLANERLLRSDGSVATAS